MASDVLICFSKLRRRTLRTVRPSSPHPPMKSACATWLFRPARPAGGITIEWPHRPSAHFFLAHVPQSAGCRTTLACGSQPTSSHPHSAWVSSLCQPLIESKYQISRNSRAPTVAFAWGHLTWSTRSRPKLISSVPNGKDVA